MISKDYSNLGSEQLFIYLYFSYHLFFPAEEIVETKDEEKGNVKHNEKHWSLFTACEYYIC